MGMPGMGMPGMGIPRLLQPGKGWAEGDFLRPGPARSRCPGHPERGLGASGEPPGPRGGPFPRERRLRSPRASPELVAARSPPGLPLRPLPRGCPTPLPAAGAGTGLQIPRQGYWEIGSLSASPRLARIDVLIVPRAGFGAKEIKIKLSVAKR